MADPNLRRFRAEYSKARLAELGTRLAKLTELQEFPDLTIFAAGSYGRLEASVHSDIDIFFFLSGDTKNLKDPRTNSFRMFGKLIEIADDMGFPKFTNDS